MKGPPKIVWTLERLLLFASPPGENECMIVASQKTFRCAEKPMAPTKLAYMLVNGTRNSGAHCRYHTPNCVNPAHLVVPDTLEHLFSMALPPNENGCRIWTRSVGGLRQCKYGRTTLFGKHVQATRAAYVLANGVDPGDLCVCHKCDVSLCIEPSHLFLGTQKENVQDMFKKGRSNHARGERSAKAVLNGDQVIEIRRMLAAGMNQKDVASAFGCSKSAIKHISKRRTWKHI